MENLTKALTIITNAFSILGKKIDNLMLEVKKQKPPVINVAPPEVNVTVPDVNVPEIKIPNIIMPEFPAYPDFPSFPEIKLPPINVEIPEIKLPIINVPETIVNVPPANITVTPTPVEFPSEMKVTGMDKLLESVSRETEDKSIFEDVNSKNPLPIIVMGKNGKQITEFGGDMTAPSIVGLKVGTTQVTSENPLPITDGFNIPEFDEISLSYTGSDLTGVVYKLNSVTVATLTLSYVAGNLTNVIKT